MLNNKKGSVLPFVLVAFFVAVTFSIVLASNSLVQNSLSNKEIKQEQAFLSAKSMSDYIEENINEYSTKLLGSSFVPLVSEDGLGNLEAKLENQGDQKYLLSVRALVDGTTQTIRTSFQLNKSLVGGIYVSKSQTYCDNQGLNLDKKVDKDNPFYEFTCNNETDYQGQLKVNGQEFIAEKEVNTSYVLPTNNYGVCDYTKNNTENVNTANCNAKLTSSNNILTVKSEVNKTIDIFLKTPENKTNQEPTDNGNNTNIDGSVSNEKGKIVVTGNGTINIWLTPEDYNENYNFYTLPTIEKKSVSDTVVVNVIVTNKNFNLIIYTDDPKNNKVNGTVYANIINPYGTVILASDDKAEFSKDIITGTIHCENLIVDASDRGGVSFNVKNDVEGNGMEEFVSLGHVQ